MSSEKIWLDLKSARECLAWLEIEMMYFRSFRTVAVGSWWKSLLWLQAGGSSSSTDAYR